MAYQSNGIEYATPGFTPYQTPYTQPTIPSYNPYMPSYTPVQQPNAMPTTYGRPNTGNSAPVRGRMVKSDTDISPSDVPMDGFSSYFPAEDGSCIYVKMWDNNGKIQTRKYIPAPDDISEFAAAPTFENEMRERFDNLENLIRSQFRKPKYYNDKKNNTSTPQGGTNA